MTSFAQKVVRLATARAAFARERVCLLHPHATGQVLKELARIFS